MVQLWVALASTSDVVRVPEAELIPAKVLPWTLETLLGLPGAGLGAEPERRVT